MEGTSATGGLKRVEILSAMDAYSALSSSQDEVKAAESQGLATLEEEAKKQKIVMEFQAHQGRVAQELAPSRSALLHRMK